MAASLHTVSQYSGSPTSGGRHNGGKGSLPARPSGRVVIKILDGLDEVSLESLDAGPKRLVEGETITVLAPLALVARRPMPTRRG